ncbi:MAG: hypothetical protein AAGC99_14860, partial [Pseudomonadota bacterium]
FGEIDVRLIVIDQQQLDGRSVGQDVTQYMLSKGQGIEGRYHKVRNAGFTEQIGSMRRDKFQPKIKSMAGPPSRLDTIALAEQAVGQDP